MSRALSPVVGILFLVGVTVLLATTVGALAAVDPAPVAPTAHLSLSADASQDRVALTHGGGETLDVSSLSVTVTVDGESLKHQPPVPFFAATGFESGPTGPFNVASDDEWSAGETGGFRLAATNDPQLVDGAHVEVTVATDRGVVATLETTAT
ncbi:type IV pilin [Halobacteriales archaeon SW_10_68_16]|nr:MAG: type IV pilin [Halobacteriales archaeon SW_10_68_16]